MSGVCRLGSEADLPDARLGLFAGARYCLVVECVRLAGHARRQLLRIRPLSEEGTQQNVLESFTWKPRPESGRDCLTCAYFARQQLFRPLQAAAIKSHRLGS